MEQVKFSDIPILSWGNEITIKGIIMEDNSQCSHIVLLPMEKQSESYKIITPSSEEWYDLQDQLDKCNVMSELEKGKILRKSQRILDQRICWKVYRRDKFKCRYCGINNVPLTVDHIITWEAGGATHEDNLLSSCRKCNKKRGNLEYGLWLQHSYYIGKSKFLTDKERKANEDIILKLKSLPRVSVIRSR